MSLSNMQVKFLRFASNTTVYGFNNAPHRSLPVKGAVAATIIRSLRTRGLINTDGVITPEGRKVLQEVPEAA